MSENSFNEKLADSCQSCQASCCKKGLIFLSPPELKKMREYAEMQGTGVLDEFKSRLTAYDGFSLYDQRNRCQFLTDDNLCILHPIGKKPNECFWWPYHVFIDEQNTPVIELSSTCCDAWRHHNEKDAAGLLDSIDEQIAALGPELFRSFRKTYAGSYGKMLIRPVNPLEWRNIAPDDLTAYRAVGEQLFPDAEWDNGIERYKKLLPCYAEGLSAAWIGNRIVAYISLWPVTERFFYDYLAGKANDETLLPEALDLSPESSGKHAFLSVLAVRSNNALLRKKLKKHVSERILDATHNGLVIAETTTEQGEKYLKSLNFVRTGETSKHVYTSTTLPVKK